MASRYWVGGTATWNATIGTKWATTSGGAGGASVPTATDDVFFDANSGAGTVTISTAACQSIDCNPSGSTFTGSFAGSGAFATITGIFRLNSTMGCTWTGRVTYTGTSGTCNFTSGGKTSFAGITINGAGGTVQLQDALNIATSVILTSGTFDTNGQSWTTPLFTGTGSTTRVLTFTSGTATITGTGTAWNMASATNMTVNKGGTINMTGSGANLTISLNSIPVGPIKFSAQTATFSCTTSNVICDGLDFTGCAGSWPSASITVHGNITLGSAMTVTAGATTITWGVTSGTATFTSNGVVCDRILTVDGVGGTHKLGDALNINARTLTLTNGTFDDNGKDLALSKFSCTNGNVRTVKFNGGTWSISGTGLCFDMTIDTNLTTVVNRVSTSTIKLTDASATAKSIEGPAAVNGRLPNVWCSAGTGTFAWYPNQLIVQGFDFTGFGGSIAGPSDIVINTYLTLSSSVDLGGIGRQVIFSNIDNVSGTYLITSNGHSLAGCDTSFQGGITGAVWKLADDFIVTSVSSVQFFDGTFDANGHNVSIAGSFTQSDLGNAAQLKLGSGIWTVSAPGSAFTINGISLGGTLTVDPGTSTIKYTDSSASDKTFAGGGFTYYNFWDATGSTGALIVTGAGTTFNDFRRDASAAIAHTIKFDEAGSGLFYFKTFSVNGSPGANVTITDVGGGATQHHLVKLGGGIISCDYLALGWTDAAPANTWFAGTHSTALSGGGSVVSGWIFGDPPIRKRGVNINQAVNRASTF